MNLGRPAWVAVPDEVRLDNVSQWGVDKDRRFVKAIPYTKVSSASASKLFVINKDCAFALREYMVTIVSFSWVCCKQWGGQKNLKYPKGVMSSFS
jgi:hypothetical protein